MFTFIEAIRHHIINSGLGPDVDGGAWWTVDHLTDEVEYFINGVRDGDIKHHVDFYGPERRPDREWCARIARRIHGAA